jgi:hypothetical protein
MQKENEIIKWSVREYAYVIRQSSRLQLVVIL